MATDMFEQSKNLVKLLTAIQNLIGTEDDTGCSGDLTVVGKVEFDAMVAAYNAVK